MTAGTVTAAQRTREPRWRVAACFVFMLVAIQVCLGPKIALSQWGLNARENAGVAEGAAWLAGRLDIQPGLADALHRRMHDTALFNGKVYNVFPPMVGVFTVLLAPLHKLLLDDAGTWLPWTFQAIVFWPLPILGFVVFRRQVGDSAWAALLTVAWMGGTAVLPSLARARYAELGAINHVLSQAGLLIFAADVLGRQRIWPALIGLLISAWTRQMTLLYTLPLAWIALQRKRLPLCAAGLIVIVTPLFVLNYLKFGSPLDSGYGHIYAGRDPRDPMAGAYHEFGLFSLRCLPGNAWYMHAQPPGVELTSGGIQLKDATSRGTSIWLTTPLLFYALLDARTWWRHPRRRLLMLGTLPVMAGLLCYHSSGFMQVGYHRFALDFVPIWLVVIAPRTRGCRRTWVTLFAVAWGLLYFQSILPNR